MKHNLITDRLDSSILADFPAIKVLFNLFCNQLPDSFLEFPLQEVSLLLNNLQRLLTTYHFYFKLFQLKVVYRLAPVQLYFVLNMAPFCQSLLEGWDTNLIPLPTLNPQAAFILSSHKTLFPLSVQIPYLSEIGISLLPYKWQACRKVFLTFPS